MHTCTITARHAGRAMYDLSLPGGTLLESEYVGDMCKYEVAEATYNDCCCWTNLNNNGEWVT